MRKIWLGIAGWLCLLAFPACAQGAKLPWEEYERLVEKGRSIAPLDVGSMFGDKVDLYSGALSFSATDVSIPGNGALPVAIGRKLSIYDRSDYGATYDYAFADWDIDLPNINGVFVTPWHDTRCTQAEPPAYAYRIYADEYWAGNHADMPGGGEMLQPNPSRPKPTTGGPYLWVTAGDVYFSCLGTIKNGSGQGFLAITKDGTRYWFDHMAQYAEPSFIHVLPGGMPERMEVARYKNVLYATRIEDRFGNWVTYTYNNTATQRVRLTQIASKDGRNLTLQYSPTSGYVSSISDGTRTWTYQYSGGHLSGIVLPDTSQWQFSLAALTDAVIERSSGDERSCFSRTATLPFTDVSGSITHPSGALASFTVTVRSLGRTNVPGLCKNYQPIGFPNNNKNDDYPIFAIRWSNLSLKSKQVQGPGLVTGQWIYEFTSAQSWDYPPGHSEPICNTENCIEAFCTSDDCAGTRTAKIIQPDGSWIRYVFGNSYRYNEGKLLAQETGDSAGSVLKTTLNTYNYATSGQPYEAKIGTSPQPRGLGFVDEYPRPLVKTETLQDGGTFVWEVAKGCTSAGLYCLDAMIRPTKVFKTGTTVGVPTGGALVVPPTQMPTLTAPASNNTGSFTVSWTGVSQATAYELQERLGSGSWSTIQNSGATSRAMADKPSGTWSYQVRGCNSAGCTAWSAIKTTAVLLPPASAPTLTAPASNTTGSYTVSWTAVTAATRYELEQRKDAGTWSNIHNAAATSKALTAQTTGAYDYRVRACNDGGCADWSTLASTAVSLSLGTPSLSVTPTLATQSDMLSAAWTSVNGATQYALERSRNGAGFGAVYNGPSTSAAFTTGVAGDWKYRVKACNSNGCGPFSPEVEVYVQSSTDLVTPPEEGSDL